MACPISRTYTYGLFCLGIFKQEVYSTPVNSEEELRGRIGLAAQRLREKLSFKMTEGAMRKRARACVRKEATSEQRCAVCGVLLHYQSDIHIYAAGRAASDDIA
ncbi:hypothetical protein J6590_032128 [Homalodisca vitripennis]|nr:hypothetical protein J6590_032128 [Homalodisca vitripennis]